MQARVPVMSGCRDITTGVQLRPEDDPGGWVG